MGKKAEKYTIPIIYLGERVNSFGRIVKLFRDKNGEDCTFKGNIRGLFFGETYLMTRSGRINRSPEISKKKLQLRETDEHDYEIQKEIVKDQRLRNKKAMQIKQPHKDIQQAINLFRPFTRNMNSIDLDRFTQYLKNQLSVKRIK